MTLDLECTLDQSYFSIIAYCSDFYYFIVLFIISIYNFDTSSVFNFDANVRNSQKKYPRKNQDSPYF